MTVYPIIDGIPIGDRPKRGRPLDWINPAAERKAVAIETGFRLVAGEDYIAAAAKVQDAYYAERSVKQTGEQRYNQTKHVAKLIRARASK